jgi:hypothetical protein
MLLVHYRTVPPEVTAPVDQRWRTIELDPQVFDSLDLATPQGVVAAIRRVNDGQVSNVQPFPHGADVYLTDTERADSWKLALTIQKNQ